MGEATESRGWVWGHGWVDEMDKKGDKVKYGCWLGG